MKISNPHLGNRKNTKPMHFLQWAPPPSPSLRDQSAFIVQLLEMKNHIDGLHLRSCQLLQNFWLQKQHKRSAYKWMDPSEGWGQNKGLQGGRKAQQRRNGNGLPPKGSIT